MMGEVERERDKRETLNVDEGLSESPETLWTR